MVSSDKTSPLLTHWQSLPKRPSYHSTLLPIPERAKKEEWKSGSGRGTHILMRTGEDTIDTLHANRKMEARFHLMNLTQTLKPPNPKLTELSSSEFKCCKRWALCLINIKLTYNHCANCRRRLEESRNLKPTKNQDRKRLNKMKTKNNWKTGAKWAAWRPWETARLILF